MLGDKLSEAMTDNLDRINTLELLEGCEVESICYEGVVGIKAGQVWKDGKVIDPRPSNDSVSRLLDEYFEQEFGGCNVAELI